MTARKVRLATNLTLPVDVVTQTVGILARKGSGKSYAARRLVEQLAAAGQQVVIVDPKGDWWGIRAHVDGKRPGLPFIILGGERGDVPLEVGAGEVVAKLVVESGPSVLLDLSLFRKAELATFMASFLETLYRLKAREQYRTPCMLVVDEADAIAPQRPMEKGSVPRMLGAIEDIVRRGRQRGLGCTLITQRSAVLNKNVLTQVEVLVAMRTVAPQDLKALKEWIDVHGTPEEGKQLMESLPALDVGTAWVWSPGWPTSAGIFKRIDVLGIETFDSGATPKAGETRREPKSLAEIDMGALRKQMAETIERAKADDPALLRKRIRGLEQEVKSWEEHPPVAFDIRPLEHLAEQRSKRREELIEAASEETSAIRTQVRQLIDQADDRIWTLWKELRALDEQAPTAGELEGIDERRPHLQIGGPGMVADDGTPPARQRVSPSPALGTGAMEMTGPMQRILDAIGWWVTASVDEPTRNQVAFIARYSPKSSGFKDPMSRLKTAGLVEYPGSGLVGFSPAGEEVCNWPERTPTTDELQRRILEQITGPMQRLLRPLIAAYPEKLTREVLAEIAGYSPKSSGFKDPLSKLRTLRLIDYPATGQVVGLEVLFVKGES